MLYCPNPNCQASNSETQSFCQTCGTFLPKRYLWALGSGITSYRPGDLLGDRYLCKGLQIFFDTKPGLLPEPFREIPPVYTSYLRLVPYRVHVPQVYDVVEVDYSPDTPVLLLTQPSLTITANRGEATNDEAEEPLIQPLPSLVASWKDSSALRQLNWLWQMAHLWDPMQREMVTSTLLQPDLLRVDSALVRILELERDGEPTPSLADLGQLWNRWIPQANSAIAKFLDSLCQNLIQGEIQEADQLIASLDEGLARLERSRKRTISIATRTDQGPSRQRNEDACFPNKPATQIYQVTSQQIDAPQDGDTHSPLVIVCDGIGGHQGGDVASGLAIATLKGEVESLHSEELAPADLIQTLEDATCAANDRIADRNDSEHRQERQRMGTTVVMAIARGHELYITHVGDSRAYWITRNSCYQVTLDDDIASREVRLGYGTFRQVLQQPISGSLVQALGMGPSNILHPTTQRFVLDGDGIFLLCSDGLSDFDRVEESWRSVILPALTQGVDLASISEQLIDLANTQNGHDNVTVGLVKYQTHQTDAVNLSPKLADAGIEEPFSVAYPKTQMAATVIQSTPEQLDNQTGSTVLQSVNTELVNQSQMRWLPLIVSILLLVALCGAIAYILFPNLPAALFNPGNSTSTSDLPSTDVSTPDINGNPEPLATLPEPGDFIQLTRSTASDGSPLTLYDVIPDDLDGAIEEENASPSENDVDGAIAENGTAAANSNPSETASDRPGTISPRNERFPPPAPSVDSPPETADQADQTVASSPEQPSAQPDASTDSAIATAQGIIPVGSVLQILDKNQADSGEIVWVQLQICSIISVDATDESPEGDIPEPADPLPDSEAESALSPSDEDQQSPESLDAAEADSDLTTNATDEQPTPFPLLTANESGWIQESRIAPSIETLSEPDPEQLGSCSADP